jgi:hypothetical protein
MRKERSTCAMCRTNIDGYVECATLVELINLVQVSVKMRKNNQRILKEKEEELKRMEMENQSQIKKSRDLELKLLRSKDDGTMDINDLIKVSKES